MEQVAKCIRQERTVKRWMYFRAARAARDASIESHIAANAPTAEVARDLAALSKDRKYLCKPPRPSLARLPPPNLPKSGALQRRPPAYLLYCKAYLLGNLYSKAYLFAAEKTSEPQGSTPAAAEARSAGAHRVCSPPLSSLPDLVDLSRVLQGLVVQKIIGRALADVLHSSR